MPEQAFVKAMSEEYTLEILGVPFGGPNRGKDSQGERFTAKTNLHLDEYPRIPLVLAHGLDPQTGKPSGEPQYIGTAEYLRTDERGHWFKGILDRSKEIVNQLWEAAQKGMLGASSGSIQHLARKAKDGTILEWPVAEMTLVEIGSGLRPVNSYAVALPLMKAMYQEAGIEYPENDSANEPEGEAEAQKAQSDGEPAAITNKENDMDEKELIKLLDERDAQKAAAVKAEADQKAAIEARAKELSDQQIEAYKAEAAKSRRLPFGEAPYQAQFADTSKYDGLDATDLSLVISTLQSADKHVPAAAMKAMSLRIGELKDDNSREGREATAYVKNAFKAATGIEPTAQATSEAVKAATDPMYTGGSTIGSDWVGTAYSSELWRAIRANANILGRIPSVVIPDGYSSAYFPLESTDPTFYKVAEATASDATLKVPAATITASQAATANKQITVAKGGARVLYTGEMTEDSLVAFVPQLREQIQLKGAEVMEHLAIDGDTETGATTNINDIAGTPASTDVFLLANGFRKLALVTNTANSRAGGALDEDDFLETMWLMGTAGIAGADLAKCAFIVDPNVYKTSLKMAVVKTKDVWTNATVESGVLTRLWGYQVIPSWQMHYGQASRKANSAGKVDLDTAGNNLYGSILGVRFDQWKQAYKRRMTMETTRIANADSWEIVALFRWGLAYRDTEAAAITYGLSI